MSEQTIVQAKPTIQTKPQARGILQRQCACGQHTQAGEECEECRKKHEGTLQRRAINQSDLNKHTFIERPSGHDFSHLPIHSAEKRSIQTKLTVNEPGDQYEQEADQVAEQVMRMPETENSPGAAVSQQAQPIPIQRFLSKHNELHRQPEDEEGEQTEEEQPGDEEEETLQAKEAPGETPTITPEVQTRIDSIRGAGQPLPESTRTFMESRFGHDFSQVRVHTDAGAAETARAVSARAFTLGHDIVFGSGAYTPSTSEGKRLLAHELTHVVQQGGRTEALGVARSRVGKSEDPSGQVRNRVARVVQSQSLPMHQVSCMMLQRQVDAAEVKEAIASIQVEQLTEKKLILHPWKIFEQVPKNTAQKSASYRRVQKALNQLRKARDAVQSATRSHKAKGLQKAKTAYEKAEQELLAATENLKAFVESQTRKGKAKTKKVKEEEGEAEKPEDKTSLIKEGIYAASETERIYYDITVDGEKISLYDHVDAYATVFEKGLEGKATGESKEAVRNMLEKSGLSDSHKKILKTISTAEGGFTSMNTWDRAVLTWGMVQWTGGDESDLTAALTIIKEVAPDAFKKRFQKYGIDVEKNKLVIVSGEGTVWQGKEAAKAVGESPVLTAVMSRAGLDTDIQIGELKAASKLEIDNPLDKKLQIEVPQKPEPKVEKTGKVKAKGKKKKTTKTFVAVRLGDIFTSEYGVGVLADQVVHGGFPGSALKRALTKFLKDHGLDPKDHTKWAADAEKALIPVVAKWPDRAKALEKNGCSKDPGTFR